MGYLGLKFFFALYSIELINKQFANLNLGILSQIRTVGGFLCSEIVQHYWDTFLMVLYSYP
jgi:hypothetical protein